MSHFVYSGFIKRCIAFSLDAIMLIGTYAVLGLILGLFSHWLMLLPMIGFWFYSGIFFVSWLYFAGFESSSRMATIGQQLLKIKVVNLDGKRISFWRATLRYFIYAILRFGVIFIPFTKKKQALHDMIASTIVVYTQTKLRN